MLVTTYDSMMVIISIIVAMLASFTALDMAGRVATSSGKVALVWLFSGGFAMGIGIWAMHFIGMLSMSLPMVMSYDASLTAISMLITVAASIFALWLVCYGELPLLRLCAGTRQRRDSDALHRHGGGELPDGEPRHPHGRQQ